MKKVIVFLFASVLFGNCDSSDDNSTQDCSTRATVRDLTGQDGCGFVFELEDGTRLEPLIRVYFVPPPKGEDPIYYFDFAEGKPVFINYEIVEPVSSCMVGPVVRITCISEIFRCGTISE